MDQVWKRADKAVPKKPNWLAKNYDNAESIQLLNSGDEYFDQLVELINNAKETLHLQTFTFGFTETGTTVADALKAAAARGVQVFMLVDAVGSKNLPVAFVKELKKAKIKFRFYSPFFSRRTIRFGRRLHHKIVVADSRTALIGGINIDNEYHGTPTATAWLDFAVLVKGKICEKPEKICKQLWGRKFMNAIVDEEQPAKTGDTGPLVCFRRNDRFRLKREVSKSYIRSINNAQKRVTIIAGYFLPGNRLFDAILDAADRGVEVNIIVAAVSDVVLFPLATRYLYQRCLSKGVHIYEWNATVLHAKAAVVDDTWCTIGSFNLNYLSAYGSIESNIDILDDSFASKFQSILTGLMSDKCELITNEHYLKRNWFVSLKYWAAYHVLRLVLLVISFLPYVNIFSRKKKVLDSKVLR